MRLLFSIIALYLATLVSYAAQPNIKYTPLTTNSATLASPTAGQAVIIHSVSGGVIVYTNGNPAAAATNAIAKLGNMTNVNQFIATSTNSPFGVTTNGVGANATNTVNIPFSSASVNGLLHQTDFATFAGKQASNAVLGNLANTGAITNANSGNLQIDTGTVSLKSLAKITNADFYAQITDARCLFVATNGNNSTAERGNRMKPYANPTNAEAAAIAGDIIKVLPGSYIATNMGKSNVVYYLDEGAVINANGCIAWSGDGVEYWIRGYGRVTNGYVFNFDSDYTKVYSEFKSLDADADISCGTNSFVSFKTHDYQSSVIFQANTFVDFYGPLLTNFSMTVLNIGQDCNSRVRFYNSRAIDAGVYVDNTSQDQGANGAVEIYTRDWTGPHKKTPMTGHANTNNYSLGYIFLLDDGTTIANGTTFRDGLSGKMIGCDNGSAQFHVSGVSILRDPFGSSTNLAIHNEDAIAAMTIVCNTPLKVNTNLHPRISINGQVINQDNTIFVGEGENPTRSITNAVGLIAFDLGRSQSHFGWFDDKLNTNVFSFGTRSAGQGIVFRNGVWTNETVATSSTDVLTNTFSSSTIGVALTNGISNQRGVLKSISAGSNISLTDNGTNVVITSTAAGSGNVTGPPTSTALTVAVFTDTTGVLLTNSTIDVGSGRTNVSAPGQMFSYSHWITNYLHNLGNQTNVGTTRLGGEVTTSNGVVNLSWLQTIGNTTNSAIRNTNTQNLGWSYITGGSTNEGTTRLGGQVTTSNGVVNLSWLQTIGNTTNSSIRNTNTQNLGWTYNTGAVTNEGTSRLGGEVTTSNGVFNLSWLTTLGKTTNGDTTYGTNGFVSLGTAGGSYRLDGATSGSTEFAADGTTQTNKFIISITDPTANQVLSFRSVATAGGTNVIYLTNATASASGGDAALVNATAVSDSFSLTNSTGTATAAGFTWSVSANADPNPDRVTIAIDNASTTVAGAVTAGDQTFTGTKSFGSVSVQTNLYSSFATHTNTTTTGQLSVQTNAYIATGTVTNSLTVLGTGANGMDNLWVTNSGATTGGLRLKSVNANGSNVFVGGTYYILTGTGYTNKLGDAALTNAAAVTIPANMLTNNNDQVELMFSGASQSGAATTNQIKLLYGSETLFDTGLLGSSNTAWRASIWITRTGNSNQICQASVFMGSAALQTNYTIGTFQTNGTDIVCQLQLAGRRTFSITNDFASAKYWPAPK